MQMAVKVGFTLDEAEQLRRIVGKKKVDKMPAWKKKIKDKFNSFLQTNWFWFTSPISECSDPKELGYVYGSCKNSETAAKEILNLPCVHEEKYNNFLFEKSLSAIKQF